MGVPPKPSPFVAGAVGRASGYFGVVAVVVVVGVLI